MWRTPSTLLTGRRPQNDQDNTENRFGFTVIAAPFESYGFVNAHSSTFFRCFCSCNGCGPVFHANFSAFTSSRRPAADANANSLAFPDPVWRNPYTDGHAYTHSKTNAFI